MKTRIASLITNLRNAWAVLCGRAHVFEQSAEHGLIDFHQCFKDKLMSLVDEFQNFVAAKAQEDAANVAALAAANAQIAQLQSDAQAIQTAMANALANITPAAPQAAIEAPVAEPTA